MSRFTDDLALAPATCIVYDPPTLEERADEAARLIVTTLFPEIYDADPTRPVPVMYPKIARIVIQAIEEGIV